MRYFFLLVLFFISCVSNAQEFKSGKAFLKYIHQKNYKAPCQCYTFSQKNTHYKADTVSGHSEWHEEIRFPDFFRIQFGDSAKGNFVIFKSDSVFNYKENKLVKSRVDSNSLLLILGGMFYRSFEDVEQRLFAAGYDLNKLSSANWNNEAVWILGGTENNTSTNTIWFSKKDYRVLRITEKMNASDVMDMRFESHQVSCKGFVETKVSFRKNGKLEQVEEYYGIRETSCIK